jgi:hypothetical protein
MKKYFLTSKKLQKEKQMFVDPYNIARKLNKKLKFFENLGFF